MISIRTIICLALIAVLQLRGDPASAADTTEAFNVGITDIEMFTDYDTGAQSFGLETLVGAGLTERFSISVAHLARISSEGRALLSEIGFRLFHTLVDTDRFDLDLIAGYGLGTPNVDNTHGFNLGIELNLDWRRLGFYSRLFYDFFQEEAEDDFSHAASTLLGGRYHVWSGGELLLETRLYWNGRGYAGGGVALGFNVTLADWIELILETGYGFAATEDRESLQVLVGAICTL